MKKSYIIALSIMLISNISLSSQIFKEDFSGHTIGGNLEGVNGWVQGTPTSTELSRLKGVSPLIEAGALTYPNYVGAGTGNLAVIDTGSVARKSMKPLIIGDAAVLPVAGEKIYLAALVSFTAFDTVTVYREVFNFNKENATTDRGRIYAKLEEDKKTVRIGFSKGSNTEINESTTLPGIILSLNNTVLFVLEQSTLSGSNNDENILYINPDLSKSKAEQTNKLLSPSNTAQSDYGSTNALYIAIRQNGAGFKIGGIVTSKSWEDLYVVANLKNVTYNDGSITAAGKTLFTSQKGKVTVYNLTGAELITSETEGRFETKLNKGLYIVKFLSENGQVSSAKIQLK